MCPHRMHISHRMHVLNYSQLRALPEEIESCIRGGYAHDSDSARRHGLRIRALGVMAKAYAMAFAAQTHQSPATAAVE